MRFKSLAVAFLMTVGQLIGSYLMFGCWLEEYEAIFHSFFAGIHTLPPVELIYIDIYLGAIPLLSKLAHFAYPHPINHYLLYIIIAACFFVIYYCAFRLLENVRAVGLSFFITILIFGFLLFPQFIVLIQSTRVSVLLCIAAFFTTALFFVQGQKSGWHLAAVSILLLLGTLMRIFTAGIATGLFLALAVLLWPKKFLASRFGWLFAIFLLLQLVLIAGLMHYRSQNDHPGERYVMNYEYAVTNRGDIYPLPSGSSYMDSVRYELLRHWLITDTVSIQERYLLQYIRHVTIADILCDLNYLTERFTVSLSELALFARRFFYQILFICVFIIILPARYKIIGALWIIIIAGVLVMLTIIGSMYDRGFVSLVCLSGAGLWFLWVRHGCCKKNTLDVLSFLVLAASYFSFIHLADISKESLRWYKAWQQFSTTAMQIDSLHPIVMPSADWVMFSNKAFEKFPSRSDGNIIMLNAGYVSFYEFLKKPYREKYNLDITNGNSVADFIRLQGEKGVVVLATHEGMRLFQEYLKAFFGINITQENLPIPSIKSPQHTLNFLRIRADAKQKE